MIRTLKKYTLYAILLGLAYMTLAYHFIIFVEDGRKARLLKKAHLTWSLTFYSTAQKDGDMVMEIDALRDAGIGYLLVDEGFITPEELARLEQKYNY